LRGAKKVSMAVKCSPRKQRKLLKLPCLLCDHPGPHLSCRSVTSAQSTVAVPPTWLKKLFVHFSGVAAVNSEQESNLITRLTTQWVDNFGDYSIVKGANFSLFHILAIFCQTVSSLFSTNLALSTTTRSFDRSCQLMYTGWISVSSKVWIRQRIGSLPYQLLPLMLVQSFCSSLFFCSTAFATISSRTQILAHRKAISESSKSRYMSSHF
jgi:hypothetical protein